MIVNLYSLGGPERQVALEQGSVSRAGRMLLRLEHWPAKCWTRTEQLCLKFGVSMVVQPGLWLFNLVPYVSKCLVIICWLGWLLRKSIVHWLTRELDICCFPLQGSWSPPTPWGSWQPLGVGRSVCRQRANLEANGCQFFPNRTEDQKFLASCFIVVRVVLLGTGGTVTTASHHSVL